MIDFILLLIIYTGIFSILSLGLNLITGYTGLLSLCQAAFFGIGAYFSAIILINFKLNFFVTLFLSGIFVSIFGILIGLPTLRLKGDYLAIATLGFGEIVRNIILNWDSLTRGPMGINNIPSPIIFNYVLKPSNKIGFAILIWIFVFITYYILRRIVHSRFGRALEAIREDEIASLSMGINITKYKIISFTIGSFFAGIAGTLWAVYNQSVTPQTFDFMLSIMILCMVVLGGLGNNLSVIIGSTIIVLISEIPRLLGLSSFIPPQTNQILFGLILVLIVIYRPQGIIGRKKINYC